MSRCSAQVLKSAISSAGVNFEAKSLPDPSKRGSFRAKMSERLGRVHVEISRLWFDFPSPDGSGDRVLTRGTVPHYGRHHRNVGRRIGRRLAKGRRGSQKYRYRSETEHYHELPGILPVPVSRSRQLYDLG